MPQRVLQKTAQAAMDDAHKLDDLVQTMDKGLNLGESFKPSGAASSGATSLPWEMSASAFLEMADANGNGIISAQELSTFLRSFGLDVGLPLAKELLDAYDLGREATRESQAAKMLRLLKRCWSAMQAGDGTCRATLTKAECEPVMQDLAGNTAAALVLEKVRGDEVIDFALLVSYVLKASARPSIASAPAAARRCIKVPAGEPAPAGYRLATTTEARTVPRLAACLEAWDIARLADGWVDGHGYGNEVGSGWRDGLGHKVVIADPSMQQVLPEGPYVISVVQGGSKGQVQLSSAGARHGQQLQEGAPGVLSKHLRSDGSRALEAEVWVDGDKGGGCQEWSVAAELLAGLPCLAACFMPFLPQ
jgi:hypothetical protein